MAGIFLAEYQLATGDQSYARALRHCSLRLEHRIQEKTGRYGHHHGPKRIPYGGKGLVIINVHAHLMWALSSHTREISSWDTWELSYEQVLRSMSSKKDGAVGYNHSARGGGQSSCRTGGMATALELVGRNGTDQRYMGRWLKAHTQHFPNTHAMTSLGPMFGFMGLKNTNKPAHRKALDEYRWMFALLTPANFSHGSYYYGQRGNYGGDGYCNYRLVANWMNTIIIGSQRSDTLWMFGNRKKGWFSGDTKTAN